MFETLSDRLQNAIKNIKGYGKITEENIDSMVREVRLALLEADVNYKVVKEFTSVVREKALGEEVKKSLTPGEMFVGIIRDSLVELLGGVNTPLNLNGNPACLMLVGLQGSGKTTTIGKLANLLRKKHNKKPLLVACDIYRPAAIEQLKQIGKELNIPVYSEDSKDAVSITNSMMGQDAINVITGFNSKIDLTGVILTKLDGDTRGGVALSVRHLTNVPIKFIGDSEKMDGISYFYPDRMASRILGMGDILSIVDKANEAIDEKEAEKSLKKMQKGKFDLEDFLSQMKQIKKLGPLENLLKLIPGASKMGLNNVNINPKDLAHIEAIILSMTPYERKHPEILKASRKERIAKGSGRNVMEVNRLLTQFEQSKKMMKMLSNGNMKLPF